MQCLSFQSELIVLVVGLTVLKMVRLATLMVVMMTVFSLLVFKDTRLLIVIMASPVMWFCNLAMQSPPLCPVQSPPNCAITILYVFNTILPMMVETSESARKYKCYMLIQAFSDQQKITVLSFLQMSLIYVRFSLLLYVPNFVCSVYGKKSI